MKTYTFVIIIFALQHLYSQDKETINWINLNSITIEDANPDSELLNFKNNEPEKFRNAKIFGFGEATHNTKEFFDIKSKYFKYLVKYHGVRTFIMEESYQSELGINQWISVGYKDDRSVLNNFSIGFWYTKEIEDLIDWMRDFNKDKPSEDQIKFYGMDIQTGSRIGEDIRKFVSSNNLKIEEELLKTADSCSNKKIDFNIKDEWWQKQIPKLEQLKLQIINSKCVGNDLNYMIRGLNYLLNFVEFASTVNDKYPKSTMFRDLKMFENAKYILENETKNGKAFVWAHNEHINNREMYYFGSEILNLGYHLKNFYQNDYYSVGFDFGSGHIKGLVTDKKKGYHWKVYHIEKPFNGTYALTLNKIEKDIYFIDMENAIQNEPKKYFEKELKLLMIGGGGYQPKPLHKIMVTKIYSKSYDGLIFVKEISPPNTKFD